MFLVRKNSINNISADIGTLDMLAKLKPIYFFLTEYTEGPSRYIKSGEILGMFSCLNANLSEYFKADTLLKISETCFFNLNGNLFLLYLKIFYLHLLNKYEIAYHI